VVPSDLYFGRLRTVEEVFLENRTKLIRCQCICGNFVNVSYGSLKRGRTKSCGCLAAERILSSPPPGKIFGRLTVVREVEPNNRLRQIFCVCQCGTERAYSFTRLSQGKTRSCGCLGSDGIRQRSTTHGMARAEEYKIYHGMIARCNNPKSPAFSRYGGRGIKVCDRWLDSFENFYADMGPRPSPSMSIDRKNVDDSYSSENCRWATRKQQARNTRRTAMMEFKGEIKSVAEWAEIAGIDRRVFYNRVVRSGWTPERSMLTPVIRRNNASYN
jgi:hypothetical protein